MKKTIRILSLILAVIFFLLAFAACSKGDESEETTSENSNAVSTNEDDLTDAEKRAQTKDNLPDWVSTKYRGRTINTLSFHENFELDTNGYGELTGSRVHDMIYKRNEAVKERLGIEFNNMTSSAAKFGDYGRELNVLANAQSADYDIIYTMGNSARYSGVEYAYFSDVSQYEYISLESPWWNLQAMKDISFDGKTLRFLIGDISLTSYIKAGAIFVNTDQYNNHYSQSGIDELYDLAIAGNWTLDVLKQKASECYSDADGDGLELDSEDFIGFAIGSPTRVKALEYGFDVKRWSRDTQGFVQVDFDTQRASDAVDKVIDLLFKNAGAYYQYDYVFSPSFASGKIMFMESELSLAMQEPMRNMTEDFAVLPTPKLDSNQEEYTSEIQDSSTLVAIPNFCPDKEFASVVIEALCAESYRNVILPFIEESLKIQYVRDSRSGQVIDIILDTATTDYFGLYNPGGIGAIISSTALMEANRFSSEYASLKTKAEEALKSVKDTYYSEY